VSEHPADRLSAYVDGALPLDEAAEVAEHLERCPDCRGDATTIAELRSAVRGLPLLDPPLGFLDAVLTAGPLPHAARLRRQRVTAAALAAVAVGWVLVLGGVRLDRVSLVRPTIGDFASAHAAAIPTLVSGVGPADEQRARGYGVPTELAGTYRLAGFRVVDGRPQAVYTNGDRAVSVFSVPGRLDTGAMPDTARQVRVNGQPAWQVPTGDADVVFVQQPGAVVVLVGAATSEVLGDVAAELRPEVGDPSLLDRLDDAARGLLDAFALRG
jgi:anti-sigma factor RsiW